jgi:hypothetical protein
MINNMIAKGFEEFKANTCISLWCRQKLHIFVQEFSSSKSEKHSGSQSLSSEKHLGSPLEFEVGEEFESSSSENIDDLKKGGIWLLKRCVCKNQKVGSCTQYLLILHLLHMC